MKGLAVLVLCVVQKLTSTHLVNTTGNKILFIHKLQVKDVCQTVMYLERQIDFLTPFATKRSNKKKEVITVG